METVESSALDDLIRKVKVDTSEPGSLYSHKTEPAPRINLDAGDVKNGLGQLVLTVVKLLHELLERQAIRRIDAGSLSDEQIERLGLTLMKQSQEIERLRKEFGLAEEDLNIDLGPLGKLL